MTQLKALQSKVEAYLNSRTWSGIPALASGGFHVSPLAQGEYNLNYRITGDGGSLVFRVNIGTQIGREDQIQYEFNALKLLEPSGVTPIPYYVDDTRRFFDTGILMMGYLPGEPLDYTRDISAAAALFAAIHGLQIPEERNHLIREEAPLTMIYEECSGLLDRYFNSELASPETKRYLSEVIHWADLNRFQERFFQEDPWPCIVNTEVNSGNFIVNREHGTIHLVDWEMPRWGDPSQDIAHFCSPLTTLWKTDYRMSPVDKSVFIRKYKSHMRDPHLRETLDDRIRHRAPYVLLRGISWSAMGWVAYQTNFDGVKNSDTWRTLQQYMDLSFIRSLFDPILK